MFREYENKNTLERSTKEINWLCWENSIVRILNDGRSGKSFTVGYYGNLDEYKEKRIIKDLKELGYNNVYFTQLKDLFINGYGKEDVRVVFDYDNEKITINGKKYKVKNDYNYAIKMQKTQIKVDGGTNALANTLCEMANVESAFAFNISTRLLNK